MEAEDAPGTRHRTKAVAEGHENARHRLPSRTFVSTGATGGDSDLSHAEILSFSGLSRRRTAFCSQWSEARIMQSVAVASWGNPRHELIYGSCSTLLLS